MLLLEMLLLKMLLLMLLLLKVMCMLRPQHALVVFGFKPAPVLVPFYETILSFMLSQVPRLGVVLPTLAMWPVRGDEGPILRG